MGPVAGTGRRQEEKTTLEETMPQRQADLPDGSSAKRSKQGDYTMRDGFLRVAAATPEVKVADVQFNRAVSYTHLTLPTKA